VPDYEAHVRGSYTLLTQLPEPAAVIAAVRAIHETAEAFLTLTEGEGPGPQDTISVFDNCLAPVAIEMLRPSETPVRLGERFEQVMGQLYRFIYHYEELEFSWIIHLRAIKSEVDSVPLPEGVQVRRATLDEQQRAFAAMQVPDMHPWAVSVSHRLLPKRDLPEIPYVVVEVADRHTLPRRRPDSGAAHRTGERVVEALRLIDVGAVDGHSIWREDSCPFLSGIPSIEWFEHGGRGGRRYPEFVLTADGAEMLQRLWPVVDPPQEPEGLSLARHRLKYSYNNDFTVDPILDSWIGLESMFLAGLRDELSFRAAVRITVYLGESSEDRYQLFELARKSYAARSAIAHGDVKKNRRPDEPLINATTNLLRRAIRKALLDGHLPDGNDLERRMLG
jgi:hypothetical protein